MKRLCLLDLDHTLIYGSYAPSEAVTLLFKYNEYLSVYERPYVHEFIKRIKEKYTSIMITLKRSITHFTSMQTKFLVEKIAS